MPRLNEKGAVTVFFMLVLPLLILFLIATVDFAMQVFYKIKLQAALDRATFAGAQVLTDKLNIVAEKNREVRKAFTELKHQLRTGSKDTLQQARDHVNQTKKKQQNLYDEMRELELKAATESLQEATAIFQKTFPKGKITPVYQSSFGIDTGTFQEFGFDEIDGVLWDPKNYKKNVEIFKVREAFNKTPQARVALAFSASLIQTPSILKLFRPKFPLRSVAAAQPYGGSLWHHAMLEKGNEHLYRTAFIPVESLEALKGVYEVFH